jgi:threonine/homoserine/homoserine lactone efflux protein
MIWSFILASALIELTPGPNMTWLAVTGATKGRSQALAAVAGICLGLAIAATVAALGLSTLLQQWPWLFHSLRIAGTVYLFYLAYGAWQDSDEPVVVGNASAAEAFKQGLITNVLNPKAYLFYAAMLPQFISGAMPLLSEVAMLSAIYVAIATLIHTVIALLSASFVSFLQRSPRVVQLRKAMALLLGLTAIWFFISTQVTQ